MFLFDRIHEISAALDGDVALRQSRLLGNCPPVGRWQMQEISREFSWTHSRLGAMPGAKRFALDPDAVLAMVSVLSSRPQSILSCLEVLRIPWPTAWIEWDENVRVTALREVSAEAWAIFTDDDVVLPAKVGILAEIDPSGRRGRFRTAWSSNLVSGRGGFEVNLPSASCGDVVFDFDEPKGYLVQASDSRGVVRDIQNLDDKVEQSVQAIGAKMTAGNVAAMRRILSHFQILFDFEGIERCIEVGFARAGVDPSGPGGGRDNLLYLVEQQMAHFARDVLSEILPFVALMMLMTAVGGADMRASDLARLNKHRLKRGELPKLEHEIVHIRLDRAQREALRAAANRGAGTGASRRLHMVGGHFVRRNEKIFWRRGHVRGLAAGAVADKTYLVRGAPSVERVLSHRA